MKKTFCKLRRLAYLALALSLWPGIAQAAEWQGGTNYWASDNWGMPDAGYPGDANNPDEPAIIKTADSEVIIQDGDWLEGKVSVTLSQGSLQQTGGTWIHDGTSSLFTRYDLLGGTTTGNGGFRIYNGAVVNVDGGELGTRMRTVGDLPGGSGKADFSCRFYIGGGQLIVTNNAIIDIHSIDSTNYMSSADGVAIVEASGVVSNNLERSIMFWMFCKRHATQTVIARLIFTEEGFTPWWAQGSKAMRLGSGDLRSDLEVDVSAYEDRDGTTPHPLFVYRDDMQDDGSFGNITISDDFYGELVPGEEGDLQPGEYYLDYTNPDFHSSMKAITLSFCNPPRPDGTIITVR